MVIYSCRTNHLVNPTGYNLEPLTFQWKVGECEGTRAEEAAIKIWSGEGTIFEGKAEPSGISAEVAAELKPRTRYFWTVSVKADNGETATSDENWFETGKMEEPWSANWITCDSSEPRHPEFFKKLELAEVPVSARLYICGLGLYEAYLNGEKIGNEHLTPYYNNYKAWVQYQSYDITNFLKVGENVVSALLGNGWYKGRFGLHSLEGSGEWKLIAELRLLYADGREEMVGTDESWMVRRSNITFSGIYDGEHRDDTLPELPVVRAKETDAPEGKLTERLSTPVSVHEVIRPIDLIHTPAGELVFDMGQNFAGIWRLHVKAPAGTKIHIQTGELLQQGNFYRENLRSALSEYYYTSDGIEKDIEPHFTFYGYRYVKIEGLPELVVEDFTGLALYSELPETAEVSTGAPLINQLISNSRWGLKSNFLDVPTDCPQRDERLGWTGDAQIFCGTATLLQDSYAFYTKYLYDMSTEQAAMDGLVPIVVPSLGSGQAACAWSDATTIIPWTMYENYGDKAILERHFSSMKAWVDYLVRIDEGEKRLWGKQLHYGDWLALDSESGDPDAVIGGTDISFLAYVHFMYSAELTARAAQVLDRPEDAQKYADIAQSLRNYITYEYYSASGRCTANTQTGMLISLRYNLTSNPSWTKKRLKEMLENSHRKLKTGFIGTPLLCPVLSESGMDNLAYALLFNEEYPGWLYSVKHGATTIWERWNSVLEDGSISSTGMNSLNHYSYGSITQWIIGYVAGLRQAKESVGWRKALMQPLVNWKLKKASASFDSPLGRYSLSWEITGTTSIVLSCEVPFGGSAELILPYSAEEPKLLGPGVYQFAYEATERLDNYLTIDSTVNQIMDNPAVLDALNKCGFPLLLVGPAYGNHTLRELVFSVKDILHLTEEAIESQTLPMLAAAMKAAQADG